jgi:hypothetical protein
MTWNYVNILLAIAALLAVAIALFSKKRWPSVCLAIALFVVQFLLLYFDLGIARRAASEHALQQSSTTLPTSAVLCS